MRIRQFTIDDYDAVHALWRRTPGMGLNDVDDSRDGIARYLLRNPRTCLVATMEDDELSNDGNVSDQMNRPGEGRGPKGSNGRRGPVVARDEDVRVEGLPPHGEAIVGVIMSGHDGRRGFIYHTCVTPDVRGHGVGSGLVEAAVAALCAEGISKVALVVFGRNKGGNAFWERLGFTARPDLTYRNKSLMELTRLDT